MTETKNLPEALAAFQARLPELRKSETAEVRGQTKDGRPFNYTYKYADLASVSQAVLPLLGELGLSWSTRPTFNEAGKFVLAYELRHAVGVERITGEYPLPASGTPQEIGSAITYARRYCLCSVTGVAPEQDDDGAAASRHSHDEWEAAKPRPNREQIIAKAAAAIAQATTKPELDALGLRVTERESEQAISGGDAVELRRQIVARLDELFPAGEQHVVHADSRQHRRMHALWREIGMGGQDNREKRLARTSEIVGRDVNSSAELTAEEADKVIGLLDAERRAGPVEPDGSAK